MFPRDFWLYLASRFAAASAMMLLRAAVAWHVYDLSQSAFHLGLIGLVQFLPVPTLMLVGGAVADTYVRRKVMMAAQSVALSCAAMLFLTTAAGAAGLPILYVAVLLVSVAWSFDKSALGAGASAPNADPDRKLDSRRLQKDATFRASLLNDFLAPPPEATPAPAAPLVSSTLASTTAAPPAPTPISTNVPAEK